MVKLLYRPFLQSCESVNVVRVVYPCIFDKYVFGHIKNSFTFKRLSILSSQKSKFTKFKLLAPLFITSAHKPP